MLTSARARPCTGCRWRACGSDADLEARPSGESGQPPSVPGQLKVAAAWVCVRSFVGSELSRCLCVVPYTFIAYVLARMLRDGPRQRAQV